MVFVLKKDSNGRHYEEFSNRHDANQTLKNLEKGFSGTLGGHIPVAGEKYRSRQYPYTKRVLWKLEYDNGKD